MFDNGLGPRRSMSVFLSSSFIQCMRLGFHLVKPSKLAISMSIDKSERTVRCASLF
jgi:hypothetical protein